MNKTDKIIKMLKEINEQYPLLADMLMIEMTLQYVKDKIDALIETL